MVYIFQVFREIFRHYKTENTHVTHAAMLPPLDNRGVPSWKIWSEVIEPKRSEIAKQLSDFKKQQYRGLLTDAFSARLLPSLGSSAYGRLIDSFLEGNINSLLDELVTDEKVEAQNEITPQFPRSSTRDIVLALDDNGDAAALRVANERVNQELREIKETKDKIEAGFVAIHLGREVDEMDLTGKCLWVPASVRHEVKKDDTSGLTRYSFFVYGGVSVQPRINIVSGRNGPLGGNSLGGGSFSNVNAQAAMNRKMSALQSAQKDAVRTQQFSDGRVRYYGAERSSKTAGLTRGAAHVTEHNPRTGQVRAWSECRDHQGNVTRVHPKMVNGQTASGQHYPPTYSEIKSMGRK